MNTRYITNNLVSSTDSSIMKDGISAILIISALDESKIFPSAIFFEKISSKLYILSTSVE